MTAQLVSSDPPRAALPQLMHQVQSGDPASFADLYDLTHPRVALVVARILRAPEHCAEVVQEVYLYAWQHARSYDPGRGSVLGWLSMVAHRRAVDRVRSQVRSSRRDHLSAAQRDLGPDTAELGVARHEAALLRDALASLSDRQRQAVGLTFLDGYSHEQAANLLGVPLGTLKTRVRDGLISLRRQAGLVAA